MNLRSKMLTPNEHIALVLHLRAAADLLDKCHPPQCCSNCMYCVIDKTDPTKRTCTKVMQSIPAHYNGLDCKLWGEDVPF